MDDKRQCCELDKQKKHWNESQVYHEFSVSFSLFYYSNIGFCSWRFNETVEGERKYLSDNKHFIQLVNLLHARGHTITEDHLKTIRYRLLNDKTSIVCDRYGKLPEYALLAVELIKEYDNISSQPIYITEVTEETLETAAEIYFKLTNCPTYNVEMKDYYLKLIKDFPLSTIIITLARLTSTQIESKSVKLESARLLLLRVSDILDLDYRRILAVTTADLSGKYETGGFEDGSKILSKVINHPVHIINNQGGANPSALIPFCSLGGNMTLVGRKIPSFADPVCTLFKERIVKGRLCYSADVNEFRGELDWKETLQRGVSLVVDTNPEYDMKYLLYPEGKKIVTDKLNRYINVAGENEFSILIETISTKKYD